MWPQIKRKQACFYDLSTCFGVFSASALIYFIFSGGLRPCWDCFGLRKAGRPFSGKKIPKRPQVYKNHKVFKLHVLSQAKKSLRPPKNNMSSTFYWKDCKKSWLIMKITLLSFYLWSHIVFPPNPPRYYTWLDIF